MEPIDLAEENLNSRNNPGREWLEPDLLKLREEVNLFNFLHPVGSNVTVSRLFDGIMKDEVRFPAEVVRGGQSVVWLEFSGRVLLSRVL